MIEMKNRATRVGVTRARKRKRMRKTRMKFTLVVRLTKMERMTKRVKCEKEMELTRWTKTMDGLKVARGPWILNMIKEMERAELAKRTIVMVV